MRLSRMTGLSCVLLRIPRENERVEVTKLDMCTRQPPQKRQQQHQQQQPSHSSKIQTYHRTTKATRAAFKQPTSTDPRKHHVHT